VPVDSEGTVVDSWLFTRAPLALSKDPARVVIVHGLGDAPVTWFSCLRNALSSCELVLPALPGAGRGPLPAGRDHLDFRRTVAWLTQVLGRLAREGEGRLVVVGHSMGGWLTARALLEDRSLMDVLEPPVLVNPAGTWYEGVERERELLSPRSLEDVDELLMQVYARPPEMPIEALQSLLETMQDPGYRGLLESTVESDFLHGPDLEALPQGMGLVWGLDDGLVPQEALRRLGSGLRSPRVVELAFCGHAPHLEAPRKMGEVLSRLVVP
jgi:pimeloyl-ACP methyl ester carboxylesterase